MIDDPTFRNTNVGQNWSHVEVYSLKLEDYRYKPDTNWSKQDATDFLNHLQDENDGVILWIQKQP